MFLYLSVDDLEVPDLTDENDVVDIEAFGDKLSFPL